MVILLSIVKWRLKIITLLYLLGQPQAYSPRRVGVLCKLVYKHTQKQQKCLSSMCILKSHLHIHSKRKVKRVIICEEKKLTIMCCVLKNDVAFKQPMAKYIWFVYIVPFHCPHFTSHLLVTHKHSYCCTCVYIAIHASYSLESMVYIKSNN